VSEDAQEKKTPEDQSEIQDVLRLLQEAHPRKTQRNEITDYS
jgi:hypothetical protein